MKAILTTFVIKAKYFFERLSSKPRIGGLSLTDFAIQYSLITHDNQVSTLADRIPPGVLVGGKIQDGEQLLQIFRHMHHIISPLDSKQLLPIVVSLPPHVVYTQSFSVPHVPLALLSGSAELNLQAISPTAPDASHMSYQVIRETPEQYELLGAFAERTTVDEFARLLRLAYFDPIAFEFPALAIARLFGQYVSFDPEKTVLVIHVSSDGLDIFLLKGSALSFDYFHSWRSVQGESRDISIELFEATVASEVQRVINFSLNRFHATITSALFIAPGFESQVKRVVEARFGITAVPFQLSFDARSFEDQVALSRELSPLWYPSLGAALRGSWDRSQDTFITLGSESSAMLYYEEQALSFIRLWRNIIMGTGLALILVFAGIALLLSKQASVFDAQLAAFRSEPYEEEMNFVRSQVEEFNAFVASVKNVRASDQQLFPYFKELHALAGTMNVVLNEVSFQSLSDPVSLSASAPDHAAVLAFKGALLNHVYFMQPELPLGGITTLENNSVRFKMSVRIKEES